MCLRRRCAAAAAFESYLLVVVVLPSFKGFLRERKRFLHSPAESTAASLEGGRVRFLGFFAQGVDACVCAVYICRVPPYCVRGVWVRLGSWAGAGGDGTVVEIDFGGRAPSDKMPMMMMMIMDW